MHEGATAFTLNPMWAQHTLTLPERRRGFHLITREVAGAVPELARTRAGLLSEDISLDGQELWGNYPQTYSLVGLINCANLLSKSWQSIR